MIYGKMFIMFVSEKIWLINEKVECKGTEIQKMAKTLLGCADQCFKESTVFAFGTNDFGLDRCFKEQGCYCICETGASNHGYCEETYHNGYRLYKYDQGNGRSILINYSWPHYNIVGLTKISLYYTNQIASKDSSTTPLKKLLN